MNPLDYALCTQTVTVYRRQGENITRFVLEGCAYSWKQVREMDVLGCRKETKFLLIVPGDTQRVFVGDRIYDGIGPEVSVEEWAGFLPVNVPGLGEVGYVQPCFWDGTLCHTEAGRK